MLDTNTRVKKNLTGLPNNTVSLCLSKTGIPVHCALSAHANDKLGHAKGEKSKHKLNNKNFVTC